LGKTVARQLSKPSERPRMIDILDAFGKIDQQLMWCIVVLLIGIAWFISGCQCVVHPDRAIEKTKSAAAEPVMIVFEALGLMSPKVVRTIGYIVVAIGFIVIVADLYLCSHPEVMR
jgi:hypothetical protein